MVGIVASRMVELYHRPTIMLSVHDGVAKGSGRSIPAYDLLSGIDAWGSPLGVWRPCAGSRSDDERRPCGGVSPGDGATCIVCAVAPDLLPRYRADAVITSEELGDDTARALAMLEPFGSGNPRPRLMVVDAVLQKAEPTRNGLHLRCTAEVGGVRIPAIGFGMGHRSSQMDGSHVCVAGAQLKADEWRGALRPQLILERVATLAPTVDEGRTKGCVETGMPPTVGVWGQKEPGPAALQWPRSARDLRDRPGRLTAVAQVLATGESVVMFTISSTRTLELLSKRLPLQVLAGAQPVCVTPGPDTVDEQALQTARLTVVEWGAAADVIGRLEDRAHVVVFDPPYRRDQALAVSTLGGGGATLHLLYGGEERGESAALLRYLVHPRFAMVCMYNAMRSGAESGDGGIVQGARTLAWEQAQVELGPGEWSRSQTYSP